MRSALPLALLGLLALSGTPALTGCDSGSSNCQEVTTTFATEDITPEGTELGAEPGRGECVAIDYVGRIDDGGDGFTGPLFDQGTLRIFYQSGGLIPGFNLGLVGLQVGESRRIRIPPSLGYGAQEVPDRDPDDDRVGIPGCSTLEFEVTLREIYQDGRQCL